MNHKKRQFTFFLLVCIFLFTGCQHTSVSQTLSTESSDTDMPDSEFFTDMLVTDSQSTMPAKTIHFPSEYHDTENELVQFQTSITVPDDMPEEIYTDIIVSYISLDFDKALELLLPAYIDIDSLTKEVTQDIEEDFPYYTAYNDQIVLSNSYYSFYLQTDKWKLLRYAIFSNAGSPDFNMHLYRKQQDFSFGTPEYIFQSIENKMKVLGLCTELQCTVYYADSNTLQNQYIPMEISPSADGTPVSFAPEDSGYYFSAVQLIEKLPVYACYYYGSGIEGGIEAANILAYVDSRGLEMFQAERIINTISYGEKKEPLLPLEDIITAIKNRFGLIITDNRVVVKEMRLCYMTQPTDKYHLRLLPVWMCNYDVTDQDGNCFQQQILINAVTGEEVIYVL